MGSAAPPASDASAATTPGWPHPRKPGHALIDGDPLIDALPLGIAIVARGVLTTSNPLFATLLGLDPAAVAAGTTLPDLIAVIDRANLFPGHAGSPFPAAAPGAPATTRRAHAGGRVLDITASPLPGAGLALTLNDVTSLVRAEDDSRRRAELLSAVLHTLPVGVNVWDPEMRLAIRNEAYIRIFGEDAAAIGDSFADVGIRRKESGEIDDAYLQAMTYDAWPNPRRVSRVRPDGTRLDIRGASLPGGGRVSVFTDVTPLQDAEDGLRRAKEAAEAGSRAKSRFLATMSHELRTPLNVIIGFADALANDPAAGAERVTEFAHAIHASGRQLLDVVNMILDVSRLEADGVDLLEEPLDLAQIADACAHQAEPVARHRGVRLTHQAGPLPRFSGDARRLRETLGSLLRVAIEFSPPGAAVSLTIARDPAGDALITIADQGTPIAPEDMPRIFDLLGRLDHIPGPRARAAGLPLYAARTLLAAHGGALHLNSGPEGGTSVVLRLPARRALAQTRA